MWQTPSCILNSCTIRWPTCITSKRTTTMPLTLQRTNSSRCTVFTATRCVTTMRGTPRSRRERVNGSAANGVRVSNGRGHPSKVAAVSQVVGASIVSESVKRKIVVTGAIRSTVLPAKRWPIERNTHHNQSPWQSQLRSKKENRYHLRAKKLVQQPLQPTVAIVWPHVKQSTAGRTFA